MSKEERKDFYRSVALGLNRPLFAVYRRVLRMYDNRNHVGKYVNKESVKWDASLRSSVVVTWRLTQVHSRGDREAESVSQHLDGFCLPVSYVENQLRGFVCSG